MSIAQLCRLFFEHKKRAGVTFPKMNGSNKQIAMCTAYSRYVPLVGFCGTPSHCLGLSRTGPTAVAIMNRGKYELSTFNNVPETTLRHAFSLYANMTIEIFCAYLDYQRICFCAKYVDEVIRGPRRDRYPALCVYDPAGGKGKLQYFLRVPADHRVSAEGTFSLFFASSFS